MRVHRNFNKQSETYHYDENDREFRLVNMGITSINYGHSGFHDECGFITKLDLSHNKLEEIDFGQLLRMGPIESLNLRSNNLYKIRFGWATHHLRFINLIGNELDAIEFPRGRDFPINLEVLELSWNKLAEFNLAGFRKVRKLDLSHNELVKFDLSPLQNCHELTHLCLNDNPLTSIDLAPLTHCTNLEYFSLNAYHITNIDLRPLASCTSLKGILLQIDDTKAIDTSFLSNIPDLMILNETDHTPHVRDQFFGLFQNFGTWYPPPRKERRSISQAVSHPAQLSTSGVSTDELVTLTYYTGTLTTRDEMSIPINKGIVHLDLSHKIISHVELSKLNELLCLKILDLSNNSLQTIDLGDLNQTSLISLDLSGNLFRHINLAPLAEYKYLESLDLSSEKVSQEVLDITPLLHCPNLKKVNISTNSKLISYHQPSFVNPPWLNRYQDRIQHVLGSDISLEFWRDLKELTEYLNELEKIDLRIYLLRQYNLASFGGIDLNLSRLFYGASTLGRRFDNAPPFVFILEKYLLDEARKHIEDGNSTIMMNLEYLEQTTLADLIPSIIQKREKELKNVVIPRKDGQYDLRYLWLTAIGFEVLHSLGVGIVTDEAGFKKISKIPQLVEISSLVSDKAGKYDSQLPDCLVEYIWKIVETGIIKDLDFTSDSRLAVTDDDLQEVQSFIDSMHEKKHGRGWILSGEKISQQTVRPDLELPTNFERKRIRIRKAAEEYLEELATNGFIEIIRSLDIHRYLVRRIGSSTFEFTYDSPTERIDTSHQELNQSSHDLRTDDVGKKERFRTEELFEVALSLGLRRDDLREMERFLADKQLHEELEGPPIELRPDDVSMMERFLREYILKRIEGITIQISVLQLTQELVEKRWISPGRYGLDEIQLIRNVKPHMVEYLEQLVSESPFEWGLNNDTLILSVVQTDDDSFSFEKR